VLTGGLIFVGDLGDLPVHLIIIEATRSRVTVETTRSTLELARA